MALRGPICHRQLKNKTEPRRVLNPTGAGFKSSPFHLASSPASEPPAGLDPTTTTMLLGMIFQSGPVPSTEAAGWLGPWPQLAALSGHMQSFLLLPGRCVPFKIKTSLKQPTYLSPFSLNCFPGTHALARCQRPPLMAVVKKHL